MQRIRSGDEVVVITGKQKGQKGKVLQVLPKEDRLIVQGIRVVTKHIKPTQANASGRIERKEAPIHISNVMLVDPQSGKPTRVRIQELESGKRVRVAVKSGAQIDS